MKTYRNEQNPKSYNNFRLLNLPLILRKNTQNS